MAEIIDITGRLSQPGLPLPGGAPIQRVRDDGPEDEQVGIPPRMEASPFITRPPDMPNLSPHYTSEKVDHSGEAEKLAKSIEEYRQYPLRFFTKELGFPGNKWRNDLPPKSYKPGPGEFYPLWSKQRQIIEAVVKHKRVTVKSCHGPGKTFVSGGLAIYLSLVWRALGLTTAPTGRQVRRLLWGEIHFIYNNAERWRAMNGLPPLGGRLLQTSLEFGPKWFVEGFSTDDPESNIPGFHEENVFAIIDEACGVKREVFDMLETVLTSPNSFVLLIGNPNDPDTEFRDTFKTDSDFYPISIAAKDTPNVRNNKTVFPKLVAHDWPEKMRKKWGEESPLYKAKVLAEFPETAEGGLIPHGKLLAALERELKEDHVITIGVDVARKGGDRIVIGSRYNSGMFRINHVYTREMITVTAGECTNLARAEAWLSLDDPNDLDSNETENMPTVNVDDINAGGGVTDILVENEIPCNGINVAEAAEAGESADGQGTVTFFNKRAQYYWKLAQAFINDEVDIDDEELAEELAAIKLKPTSRGSLKIIPKELIKKKLGRSPDKAEAMMLAWSEEESDANQPDVWVL